MSDRHIASAEPLNRWPQWMVGDTQRVKQAKKRKQAKHIGLQERAAQYADRHHCGYDDARAWLISKLSFAAGYRAALADARRKEKGYG